MIARRVVVHGQVQGVFFRASCRRAAQEAGVAGWVRNRPDGTVEALFEGPHDGVRQMVEWAHHGPPHACVDRVDVTDEPPTGTSGFAVTG
ncbi:acylphosphatase [Kribbella jejuensis]|uniref:Acylphosphatase n=1 Tax=Kribbella jejuensis TaxID=236068 RepID=A0A542DUY6_9ACTN|nr:acylphosphatase [Kribbella jejuensis]TQJ06900.1 acylphosphatase [Kribbella jejuensis]